MFFFKESADPRNHHPSPTQRSPDLPRRARRGGQASDQASLVGQAGAGAEVDRSRAGHSRNRSDQRRATPQDRKSTRLNSSHANISYAVFCLKKKTPNLIASSTTSIS